MLLPAVYRACLFLLFFNFSPATTAKSELGLRAVRRGITPETDAQSSNRGLVTGSRRLARRGPGGFTLRCPPEGIEISQPSKETLVDISDASSTGTANEGLTFAEEVCQDPDLKYAQWHHNKALKCKNLNSVKYHNAMASYCLAMVRLLERHPPTNIPPCLSETCSGPKVCFRDSARVFQSLASDLRRVGIVEAQAAKGLPAQDTIRFAKRIYFRSLGEELDEQLNHWGLRLAVLRNSVDSLDSILHTYVHAKTAEKKEVIVPFEESSEVRSRFEAERDTAQRLRKKLLGDPEYRQLKKLKAFNEGLLKSYEEEKAEIRLLRRRSMVYRRTYLSLGGRRFVPSGRSSLSQFDKVLVSFKSGGGGLAHSICI